MDKSQVEELVRKGQNERAAFFEEFDNDLIAQTVCAMANTEGGHIIVGIHEARMPIDESKRFTLKGFVVGNQHRLFVGSELPLLFDSEITVEKHEIGLNRSDRLLVLGIVKSSATLAFKRDGLVWKRTGSSNILVEPDQDVADRSLNADDGDKNTSQPPGTTISLNDVKNAVLNIKNGVVVAKAIAAKLKTDVGSIIHFFRKLEGEVSSVRLTGEGQDLSFDIDDNTRREIERVRNLDVDYQTDQEKLQEMISQFNKRQIADLANLLGTETRDRNKILNLAIEESKSWKRGKERSQFWNDFDEIAELGNFVEQDSSDEGDIIRAMVAIGAGRISSEKIVEKTGIDSQVVTRRLAELFNSGLVSEMQNANGSVSVDVIQSQIDEFERQYKKTEGAVTSLPTPFFGAKPDFRRNASQEELCLDVHEYAEALTAFFDSAKEDLCFGLFGSWGRGKTKLIEETAKLLVERRYSVVNFKAWKYRTTPECWAYLFEQFWQHGKNQNWRLPFRAAFLRSGPWPLVIAIFSIAVSLLLSNHGLVLFQLIGFGAIFYLASLYFFQFRKHSTQLKKNYAFRGHADKLGLQAAIGDDLKAVVRAWIPDDITNVDPSDSTNKDTDAKNLTKKLAWVLPSCLYVLGVALILWQLAIKWQRPLSFGPPNSIASQLKELFQINPVAIGVLYGLLTIGFVLAPPLLLWPWLRRAENLNKKLASCLPVFFCVTSSGAGLIVLKLIRGVDYGPAWLYLLASIFLFILLVILPPLVLWFSLKNKAPWNGYFSRFVDDNPKKILLVVDDLDRCENDNMLEIIESTMLLLDDDDFRDRVQIVMLVEDRAVEAAIAKKYDHLWKAQDEPENVKNRIVRENIEKIFLAQLKLIELTEEQRLQVFAKYMGKSLNEINYEVVVASEEEHAGEPDRNGSPDLGSELDDGDGVVAGNVEVNEQQAEISRIIGDITWHDSEREAIIGTISRDKQGRFVGWGPRSIRCFLTKYQIARAILSSFREEVDALELVEALLKADSGELDSGTLSTIERVAMQVV